jgi:hypothetical protein
MAFLAATASWSSHWGLAPQLSTTYGQFDNGAKVFEFYQNFAGTSLSASWINMGNAGTTTVNNGVTVSSSGEKNNQGYYYNGFTATLPSILDACMKDTGTGTVRGSEIGLGTSIFGGAGTRVEDYEITPAGTTWYMEGYAGANVLTPSYASGTKIVLSGSYNNTNAVEYENYNPVLTGTGTAATASVYPNFGVYQDTIFVQWMRVRSYPPNGVMPTVSFGAVTKVITSGHQISFQQTSLPSGTKWGIRLNNTTAVVWQNSTSQYDNLTGLGNGAYTFQVINAIGYVGNPSSGVLTMNGANLSQSIHFQGYYANFTETGLPTGTEWYVNLSNQPGLSEASTGQHLSGTSNTISTHLPNGTYTATYQTNQKTYHTAGSGSFTVDAQNVLQSVVFSPYYYDVNFTALSKPSSVMWGVNMSGTVKTGNGNLDFKVTNGTYFFNASAINGSFDNPEGWWRLTNDSGGSNSMILLHNVSSYGGIKVIVHGSNVNDNITFQRAYNITFEEVGIANTFQWDVNLSNGLPNGFGTTLDQSIILSDSVSQVLFPSTEGNYINGSYSGSIQLLIYGSTGERFLNSTNPTSFSLSVSGNNLKNITNFTTQYYFTDNTIPSVGGYSSPASGWNNAFSKINLVAVPNSGYQFTGWIGTGFSSYTGVGYYVPGSGEYAQSVTIMSPITENATFNNFVVLTFFMQNLTQNQKWGIQIIQGGSVIQWDNVTSNYIYFDIAQGTYSYTVTGVQAFPQSGTVSLTSAQTILLQYKITTFQTYFNEIGLPSGTHWGITIGDTNSALFTLYSNSQSLNFLLPNGSYMFSTVSVYGYYTNNSSGSFVISGNSFTDNITWTEGNALIGRGILYFAGITLNTTDFTIPAGSQIPINIDWALYQSYETANLSNVMIMNSSFSPLYAWVEDNATSTATASNVWVKLQTGIPAYSSQVVYLAFFRKSINNLDPIGYWGEAPQLSPVYDEYNNIKMVMNYGLSMQIYILDPLHFSADDFNFFPLPLMNANYSSGTVINGVYPATSDLGKTYVNFIAISNPFFSPLTGTARNIYIANQGGPDGVPYGGTVLSFQANNVIFAYHSTVGTHITTGGSSTSSWPLGNWPNPPISTVGIADTFLAKAQGFIQMNQPQTTFYYLDSGGRYIQVQSGGNGYMNNNWTSTGTIVNYFGSGGGHYTPRSVPVDLQGTARISFLFDQYEDNEITQSVTPSNPTGFIHSVRALWQLWTSHQASFYSPTPLNELPSISIGQIASSYSSFYEYGLPANTNWTIAISSTSGQFIQTYTSNSNVIYNYLSSGTYIYTVGSIVNGTYYSGIDGQYIPSPVTGHVIVTGIFTVQIITWHKAQILQYQMQPGQVSYDNGHIILPIFVTNLNNVPANTTVIKTIWQHMNISYVSKLQNLTSTIKFTFSTSGYGMFAIFFTLSLTQVKDIKSSNATLSMVSSFKINKYYTGLATGIAGSSAFVNVGIKGQNIVTLNNTNATSNLTSVVPWYIGLIAPYYPQYSPNPLIETENILFWVFDNSGGKALTIIVAFATLIYIFYMMTRAKKVRGRTKRQILTDQKIDEIHENIVGGN